MGFNTTNHEFLLAKLYACGFSKDALKLIFCYMSERLQRSKIHKSLVVGLYYYKRGHRDLF